MSLQSAAERLTLVFALCILFGCAGTADASGELSASPTAVDFGSQAVSTTATKTVTVTNRGRGSMRLSSVAITGSTAFSVSGWNGQAMNLSPSQSASFTVTFAPQTPIASSATLNIAGNGNRSTIVSLTGAGTSSTTPPPPSTIAVSISPPSAALQVGLTQQFVATVSGTTNTSVTWAVNGIQGGNATVGTISTSGLYAVPAAVPTGGSVSIRATSVADSTKVATASVIITGAPTPVTIAVSPTTASVQTAGTQQFTASVSGTSNTGVKWLVNGVAGGSSSVGTISTSGLYTAPPAVPSGGKVTVTATSAYDVSKSANAVVTIAAAPTPVAVTMSPTTATLQTGATQQFSATVTGTTNTSVTWWVAGVQGGNSNVGTVSSTGLYTAPASAPATNPVTVTAKSAYDSTKAANATVTVNGASTLNYYVSPTGSDSNDGKTSQTAWASIAHADAALQLGPGGTVVHVAPGTYSASLTTNRNGTASARIKFISDTKWGAMIRRAWISNGSYVDIVGFDISVPTDQTGLEAFGAYTGVLSNRVHDIGTQITTCFSGGAIYLGPKGHNTANGNVVRNMGSQSGRPCERAHGIYIDGPYNAAFNNIVSGAIGFGIHLWHDSCYDWVVNNTVFENYIGGILVGNGNNVSGCTVNDYTTVNNNIVLNNGYDGRYGISESGSVGSHNVYQNNLTYDNHPSNFSLSGKSAANTVSADPAFVNYRCDGTGDYHLQANSPAIDKGTSSQAPSSDLDGGPRPMGSASDIGASEYGTTRAVWPWW